MLAGVMAVAEGEKYFSLTKPLAQPLQSLFLFLFRQEKRKLFHQRKPQEWYKGEKLVIRKIKS